MEIDHLTVPVTDYEASKRFYVRALQPLGYGVLMDWPDARKVFLGSLRKPSSFWISESGAAGALDVSLLAPEPGLVDAFHTAAVAAGARSAEEPGIRERYSRDYYAARILDPDGNSIEVVHRGEAAAARFEQRAAA